MSWQSFVNALNENSRPKYQHWASSFQSYQDKNNGSVADTVIGFFENLHEENYATSTIWSIYSIIKTYLQITQNFRTADEISRLTKMFKNWEKEEEVKNPKYLLETKSKNFSTRHQIMKETCTKKPSVFLDISSIFLGILNIEGIFGWKKFWSPWLRIQNMNIVLKRSIL